MKRFAIMLAATGLAACSNNAPEAPAQTTPAEITPGSYSVTQADGSRMMSVLADGGTYNNTVTGAVVESGNWERKDDGSTCFTPTDGSSDTPVCYTTSSPDADGSFTVTPTGGGEPLKVRKVG